MGALIIDTERGVLGMTWPKKSLFSFFLFTFFFFLFSFFFFLFSFFFFLFSLLFSLFSSLFSFLFSFSFLFLFSSLFFFSLSSFIHQGAEQEIQIPPKDDEGLSRTNFQFALIAWPYNAKYKEMSGLCVSVYVLSGCIRVPVVSVSISVIHSNISHLFLISLLS